MKFYISAIWSFISFLMQPEDSVTGYEESPEIKWNGAGIAKAVFWMVVAVTAGLMISEL